MVEDGIRSLKQNETAFNPTIEDIIIPEINMLNEITELGKGIFSQSESYFYISGLYKHT